MEAVPLHLHLRSSPRRVDDLPQTERNTSQDLPSRPDGRATPDFLSPAPSRPAPVQSRPPTESSHRLKTSRLRLLAGQGATSPARDRTREAIGGRRCPWTAPLANGRSWTSTRNNDLLLRSHGWHNPQVDRPPRLRSRTRLRRRPSRQRWKKRRCDQTSRSLRGRHRPSRLR